MHIGLLNTKQSDGPLRRGHLLPLQVSRIRYPGGFSHPRSEASIGPNLVACQGELFQHSRSEGPAPLGMLPGGSRRSISLKLKLCWLYQRQEDQWSPPLPSPSFIFSVALQNLNKGLASCAEEPHGKSFHDAPDKVSFKAQVSFLPKPVNLCCLRILP